MVRFSLSDSPLFHGPHFYYSHVESFTIMSSDTHKITDASAHLQHRIFHLAQQLFRARLPARHPSTLRGPQTCRLTARCKLYLPAPHPYSAIDIMAGALCPLMLRIHYAPALCEMRSAKAVSIQGRPRMPRTFARPRGASAVGPPRRGTAPSAPRYPAAACLYQFPRKHCLQPDLSWQIMLVRGGVHRGGSVPGNTKLDPPNSSRFGYQDGIISICLAIRTEGIVPAPFLQPE